jgi:ribonuclease PH
MDFSERGVLQVDVKFAPFAGKEHRGSRGRGRDEEQLSQELRSSLEAAVQLDKFPKSVVDVYIIVLEAGGGIAAAAATAASLALADAGIDCFDLVAGCDAGIVGGELRVDLTADEIEAGSAVMSVAMMPSLQEVTHMSQSGEMTPEMTTAALEQCLDACASLHADMVRCLRSAASE